ncbi:MAG: hypothetical protein WAU69_05910 [Solirubrobacteraceae bacterium]
MDDLDPLALPEPIVSILSPQALLPKIYEKLGEACQNEALLEHGWVTIASLLIQYRNSNQWRADGFESFDAFMETLRARFKRGKSQLRSYLGVAEYFLPTISGQLLADIGISNALEMKRQAKLAGKPVPEEIVLAAKDLSTKELRARLAQAFHIQDEPSGAWFDFQGTYFTAEQRAEFKDAVKVAMKVLGIKPNIPDHIARGEIMLAFAREFFATYAPEAYGLQPTAEDDETSENAWVLLDLAHGLPVEIFRNQKQALEGSATAGPTFAAAEFPRAAAVKTIRRVIFERDNYTCTNCGDSSLNWDSGHMHEKLHRGQGGNISVANGITLCYRCHLLDEEVGHGKRQPQWSAGSGQM